MGVLPHLGVLPRLTLCDELKLCRYSAESNRCQNKKWFYNAYIFQDRKLENEEEKKRRLPQPAAVTFVMRMREYIPDGNVCRDAVGGRVYGAYYAVQSVFASVRLVHLFRALSIPDPPTVPTLFHNYNVDNNEI